MHFGVSPEHLEFFYRHHYIEFEDLLTPDEVDSLNHALDSVVQKRQGKEHINRDTWRDDPQVKKVVLRPHFAEIAAHLMKKREIRIGYDQLFTALMQFSSPVSLEQISSLQGMICGLMLQLSEPPHLQEQSNLLIEEDLTSLIPIPQKKGSGIFFTPSIPLSLESLTTKQLLIVYCASTTLYRCEKNDPHVHHLKNLNYAFGDRLKSSTHPLVYRQ